MPEIRVTPFAEAGLGAYDTICMDINVLPGTTWRIEARGPGRLNHEDLQRTLNTAVAARFLGGNNDYMQLQGSTATLQYDCTLGVLTGGTITITQDYVDTTAFGVRYGRALPADRDTPTLERERIRQENARKAAATRDVAEKVARTTLERMLNEDQLKQLADHGYFDVIGNLGTRYRLYANAYSGNVYWIDETGYAAGNFCAHPDTAGRSLDGKRGRLPVSDSVIGQKLMLETDEVRFLSLANLFGGTYPPVVSRGQAGAAAFPPGMANGWIPLVGCECQACQTARHAEVPAAHGDRLPR